MAQLATKKKVLTTQHTTAGKTKATSPVTSNTTPPFRCTRLPCDQPPVRPTRRFSNASSRSKPVRPRLLRLLPICKTKTRPDREKESPGLLLLHMRWNQHRSGAALPLWPARTPRSFLIAFAVFLTRPSHIVLRCLHETCPMVANSSQANRSSLTLPATLAFHRFATLQHQLVSILASS